MVTFVAVAEVKETRTGDTPLRLLQAWGVLSSKSGVLVSPVKAGGYPTKGEARSLGRWLCAHRNYIRSPFVAALSYANRIGFVTLSRNPLIWRKIRS